MKRSWKGLKALTRSAACLFTVAALLLSAGCGKKEDEEDISDLTGTERVKAEVEQVLNELNRTDGRAALNGALDMTLSVELENGSYNGLDLNDFLRDSKIGLRMEAKPDRYGLAGEVTFMGDQVLGGTLLYDNGVVGFQVPELDSSYYTVDLSKLDGGQEFLAMMEQMGTLSISTEDIMSVLGRYIDLVGETVTEDNTTRETGDFDFDKLDGEASGKIYVFTPTAEDVEGLLTRLADEIENDEELRDLVLDYAVQISAIASYTPTGEEKDELKAQMAQSMSQTAQELRDMAEDAGREVEDMDLSCTLCTGSGGAWKAEVSLRDDGDRIRLCAERNDGGFAVWMDNGDMGSVELTLRYETPGDTSEGTVVFNYDAYDHFTATLTFENVTGKTSSLGIPYGNYTLSVPNMGTVYLDVTGGGSGTDHTVRMDIPALDRYCQSYNMPDLGSARIVLHTTDQSVAVQAPSGPSVDLTGLSDYEIADLFSPWEDKLEAILMEQLQKTGIYSDLYDGGYGYDYDDDYGYGYGDYGYGYDYDDDYGYGYGDYDYGDMYDYGAPAMGWS